MCLFAFLCTLVVRCCLRAWIWMYSGEETVLFSLDFSPVALYWCPKERRSEISFPACILRRVHSAERTPVWTDMHLARSPYSSDCAHTFVPFVFFSLFFDVRNYFSLFSVSPRAVSLPGGGSSSLKLSFAQGARGICAPAAKLVFLVPVRVSGFFFLATQQNVVCFDVALEASDSEYGAGPSGQRCAGRRNVWRQAVDVAVRL